MITVNVENADREILNALMQKMQPHQMREIMRKASENAIKDVKPDVIEGVRSKFTLERLKNVKIKTRANEKEAVVKPVGTRFPLHYFKHSPRVATSGRGSSDVHAEVLRGHNVNKYPAFIHKSGVIFRRVRQTRLPIERLYGASLPEMATKTEVREKILQKMLERYNEELMKYL